MNITTGSEPSPRFQLEPEQRPSVNPYLFATKLMGQRLVWDLNWKSWVARFRLSRLLDQYIGDKAVILCNGPSLNKVDFSVLEQSGVYTFGLNKINLLFERTTFRPACIVAMNRLVIGQNSKFYNETDIPLFLNSTYRKGIKPRKNIIFLHFTPLPRRFARNCSFSMLQGHTVTYAALQLAYHMGFTKVALVGADHNFSTQGPPNATVRAKATDPDHFHPEYFAGGDQWQLPDYRGIEVYYELARETYSRFGRQVVNCTVGGMLEIFDRQNLNEFLKEP